MQDNISASMPRDIKRKYLTISASILSALIQSALAQHEDVIRVLYVGSNFLSGGLVVPNITSQILNSLTSSEVDFDSYSTSNASWTSLAAEVGAGKSGLSTKLSVSGQKAWDFVILQGDSGAMEASSKNAKLADQQAAALSSLVSMADEGNATIIVLLTPPLSTSPADSSTFPATFPSALNGTSQGFVGVTNLAADMLRSKISLAPVGLAYAAIYDLAVGLTGKSQVLQLPAGPYTPFLLYQPGFQLPSDVGSYLVGLTVASTISGCRATGKAFIPPPFVGTLWPNLLQTSSDNLVFQRIVSPHNYPSFPWEYRATACTP